MVTSFIEAEFEDGFVVQDSESDSSVFVEGRNVFYDILNRLHEAEHGRMTRFALVTPDEIVNVDFTVLPLNAQPVRDKLMQRKFDAATMDPLTDAECLSIEFGYQYTDEWTEETIREVETVS